MNKNHKDIVTKIQARNLLDKEIADWLNEEIGNIEELVRNAYEKGINDCLDIVEKVQAECLKNDGCRNKCDEPYACAYGTRIFGEILALKEQKNG